MRAVIYARYSSELQRDASIEDQVRVCRRRIDAEGWSLERVYSDHGASGASHLRAGYQALLQDARRQSSTSSWRRAWTACRAIRNTWPASTSSCRSTACSWSRSAKARFRSFTSG